HGDGIGINHMAPHLLNRQLSTEVRTSLTRFRLGGSGLGVVKARLEGVTFIDRTCTRCTEGVVDNAMHFIFECTATSSIREQLEFAMGHPGHWPCQSVPGATLTPRVTSRLARIGMANGRGDPCLFRTIMRACMTSFEPMCTFVCTPCFEVRSRKSRTPRGRGRPSSLTADGLGGVSHLSYLS
ncbi:hypothetical protein QJQ45_023228, partial [Haematococcus lacustris]